MASKHTPVFGSLLGAFVLVAATSAGAQSYTIPATPPTDFSQIETVTQQEIPAVLGAAQCGGSIPSGAALVESLTHPQTEAGPGTPITRVDGAPGRSGYPFANLPSGMAVRRERGGTLDDGFDFPDSATGLSTACDVATPHVARWVWEDPPDGGDGAYVQEMFPNPYFEDPPCAFSGDGSDGGAQTPGRCANFCGWLNGFTYPDCQVFSRTATGGWRCAQTAEERGRKYTCTEEWATEAVVNHSSESSSEETSSTGSEQGGQSSSQQEVPIPSDPTPLTQEPTNVVKPKQTSQTSQQQSSSVTQQPVPVMPQAQQPQQQPVNQQTPPDAQNQWQWIPDATPAPQSFVSPDAPSMLTAQLLGGHTSSAGPTGVPNCIVCHGQACRCPGPGCQGLPSRTEQLDPLPLPQRDEKIFASFDRHYDVSTARDAVTGTTKPGGDLLAHVDAPVECYGFYEEFDTKYWATQPGDRRCVIGFPYTRATLRDAQSTVGDIAPDPPLFDPAPEAPASQQSDAWHPIAGGMTFPSEGSVSAGSDLTSPFFHPTLQTLTAVEQRTPQDPMAKGSAARATDMMVSNDTGDARPLTQWIQTLEQEAADAMSPATVRLIVPGNWIAQKTDAQSGAIRATSDPRDASVNVQLRADDDIPGALTALAERFFALRSEEIPVIIPFASPLELRAHALQWRVWMKNRERLGLPFPSETWALVGKLDDYANAIDQYRALRAQLAITVSNLFGEQTSDTAAFVQWMHDQSDRYRAFLEQRKERESLRPFVTALEKELVNFSDNVDLPWCHASLATVPVYPLNDPWNPARPSLVAKTSCDANAPGTFPLLCLPTEQNFVFDLTPFASHMAERVVPVLHVAEEAITIPAPPGDTDPAPDVATLLLPDLPPVPSLSALSLGSFSPVTVRSVPPLIDLPPPVDLTGAKAALVRATEILHGRNDAYAAFWNGLEPPAGSNTDALTDAEQLLACPQFGEGRCDYVEPALEETLQYITAPGALPDALLQKIAPPQSTAESSSACDPADTLCTPTMHTQMAPAPTGWQVIAPANASDDSAIGRLRKTLRTFTIGDDGKLQEQEGGTPLPFTQPAQNLYDIFAVPAPIPLVPQTP